MASPPKSQAPKGKRKAKAKPMVKPPRKQPAIDKREAFIRAYLIHKNVTRAYREAGFEGGTAIRQNAHHLFTSHYVQERLKEERARAISEADIKVDEVFNRLKAIAFADPSDITGYEIGACRYCNGVDHAYHWRTPREYEAALEDAIRESDRTGKPAALPTNEGGYGYSTHLAPNPDCPECDGYGIPRIVFKDTRLLTEAERALFAGLEQTQTGLRYRFNDQSKALESLAQHLQFYRERDEANAKSIANWLDAMAAQGRIQGMPLRKDTTDEGESK